MGLANVTERGMERGPGQVLEIMSVEYALAILSSMLCHSGGEHYCIETLNLHLRL